MRPHRRAARLTLPHLSGFIPITDAAQIEPAIKWPGRAAETRLLRAVETLAGFEALYCNAPLSAASARRSGRWAGRERILGAG